MKKTISILIVCIFAFILSACGASEVETIPTATIGNTALVFEKDLTLGEMTFKYPTSAITTKVEDEYYILEEYTEDSVLYKVVVTRKDNYLIDGYFDNEPQDNVSSVEYNGTKWTKCIIDWEDADAVQFICNQGIDFYSVSFVTHDEDYFEFTEADIADFIDTFMNNTSFETEK